MVAHDRKSNTVITECLKNRRVQELTRAYQAIYDYLTARGLQPKFQVVDNECPEGLHTFMAAKDIDFRLVLPHYHRKSPEEKSIGICKEHFLAVLCSTYPAFPLHL